MKIEIMAFKESGKFYASEVVENDRDIPLFDDKFKLFIKDNIPNIGEGYIVVQDNPDSEDTQSFHIRLYKHYEIFNLENKMNQEECAEISCWYNSNGNCACCDDYRDNDKGKECMSYIDKGED